MKKIVAILVVATMLLSGFSALAQTTTIAVIYPATIDDKGWCQAMDTGINDAIASGCDIEYTPIESVAVEEAEGIIDRLVGEYDIILAHGAQFANAMSAVAEENPEQIFVASDQVLGDNVFAYLPASEEPGYVNGYMAGLATESGKVGVVGSSNSGDSKRYVCGFILGFRAAKADAEDPMVTWTGSFNDTVGAGDIADIMISAGCDVLTGSAQQAVGALRKAAAADNVKWVSQTYAQMENFPEITLCAADYDYKAVIEGVLEQIEQGVVGGTCITMTFANGGFKFRFTEDANLLSEENKAAISAVIEEITANPLSIDFDSVVLE